MIVFGLDPGFASFGVAVVNMRERSEEVLFVDVIRTAKEAKKREVRSSDENVRRGQEIAAHLERLVEAYHPVAFAAESVSFKPGQSATMHKMGIAWGVICAVAERHGLPVLQASPQKIKKRLCGSSTASKGEVQTALERLYTAVQWPPQAGLVEHAADALAAVLACDDSHAMKIARRLLAGVDGATDGLEAQALRRKS